jgi:hypothetical protein
MIIEDPGVSAAAEHGLPLIRPRWLDERALIVLSSPPIGKSNSRSCVVVAAQSVGATCGF